MSPAKKGIDLSLIIPIYNGNAYVEETTRAYREALEKSSFVHAFEIILVTNNCSDRSPETCARLAKSSRKIIHLDFPFKTLKGGAVIRGFEQAKYPFLGFVDVDNATPPEEFLKLIPAFHEDKMGASIASRKMKESVMSPPQPFFRRMLGESFSIIREWLFNIGIKDSQCGAKLFRREAISPFTLTNHGFSFDVELLYRVRQRGYAIHEEGIHWHDKTGTTVKWTTPLFMLYELIRLRLALIQPKK